MKAKALAHANIALIKYWGKENEQLSLPFNSSLSLTLDAFYTITEVEFNENFEADEFYLNDKKDHETLIRVQKFVNLFRDLANVKSHFKIKSVNHVPTAAGLASSASAFAALGMALNSALKLNLTKSELSTLVRRGSGSATRSLYGGFVKWEKGHSNETSKAIKIADADFDICMIAVIVDSDKKQISSTKAMQDTVVSSPFYPLWPKQAEADLKLMETAIANKDLKSIGELAENNAFLMHASMLASRPSIMYFKPETIKVIELVHALRSKGILAYITMDAGPNVKIIAKQSESEMIKTALAKHFNSDDIIISGVGKDAYIIE